LRQAGSDTHRRLQLRPRQAEIEELYTVRREEHVGRLQVAVDDASRVQGCQCAQHSQANRHRFGHTERSPLQTLGQSLAFQQFHRNEQLPIVLANFVDLADVWMVDACLGAGFTPEAASRRFVLGQRRHRFQRNRALQPLVPCSVDNTHPAFAELASDGVVPDTLDTTLPTAKVRRGRWRRRSLQPPIKGAQSSLRGVVDPLVRH
jgi:hypothetical protein